MEIGIPEEVKEIIKRFEQNGFEAYAVGGCVRDALLGTDPADWDITTDAEPEKIKKCFPDLRIIETGIKHGTLTLLTGSAQYEVTTYRCDGEYKDCRHPESVSFTPSLEQDLARRDFTFNALAYNGKELVDCFGGVGDLSRGLIRCVGNASDRFSEDALRILRALRFSSVCGFSIEEKTKEAIFSKYRLLEKISAERVFSELQKLLCGRNVYAVLTEFAEIFAFIIPEIAPCIGFDQNNPYHNLSLWEHTAAATSYAPPDSVVRFAMLLHDLGKPLTQTTDENGASHYYGHPEKGAETAQIILKRLKCSNSFINDVTRLVALHDVQLADGKSIKKLMAKYPDDLLQRLFYVKRADISAQSEYMRAARLEQLAEARDCYRKITAERPCLTLRELKVNGHDIIRLGVEPGAKIGFVLNKLLDSVVNGELENDRAVLLEKAERLLDENTTENTNKNTSENT